MTPQERQMVDDLFDRLTGLENAPRDADAAAAVAQGQRRAPNAVYALVQTVLVQDEALKRAHLRIQELEGGSAEQQPQQGGFLDSMRDALFGQSQTRGSVPNVRPADDSNASRPTWNSGQVLGQGGTNAPYPGQSSPRQGYQDQGYPGQSYQGQGYPGQQTAVGGGGSFLGTAAAAAAGMVGGSLLLGSIRSMMGGSHQGFGDGGALAGSGRNPWSSDQSSDLARDAGLNDIGRQSSNQYADNSHGGSFDQAQADADQDQDQDQDDGDFDSMDMDSDDGGGHDESDFA